ncbi:MAG: Uma2 family endonuclease, partial [Caldilineaceae bacterium]
MSVQAATTDLRTNGITKLGQSNPVPEDIKLWRISVEQYHAMIRSGAFDEDAPIELLEGWLVEKMPKSPSPALATDLVAEYLRAAIRPGWFVRTQDPITLTDSEPEPDVCVIKGNLRQYAQQHPQATDVGLVIEISDSSLGKDRGSKKRIYAHAGIPI